MSEYFAPNHVNLLRGVNIPFLPDVHLQFVRTSHNVVRDLVGLVYEPLKFDKLQLNPKDIYSARMGEEHNISGGSALEVALVGISARSRVINASAVQIRPGYAGGTIKLLAQTGMGNVHLIWVDEKNVKKPHYHDKLVEIYFVLQGSGRLELQDATNYAGAKKYDAVLPINPGDVVVVPPKVIHNSVENPGEHMIIQVVGIPEFSEGDMHFV